MPQIVPQESKAESSINAQPKNLEKNSVQLILLCDIAGYGTNEIAEYLGMSVSRISIIKSSPLYQAQRASKFQEMSTKVVEGTANKILEDPARKLLLDAKVEAAEMKVDLALRSKNEYVRSAACSEILGIAGIMPQKQNSENAGRTIVMEEKLAERFGFAKNYKENVVERKITIVETP